MTDPAFLLDTNVLIYLAEDSSPALTDRVERAAVGEVVTSSIAFAEFARGIHWHQPHAENTVERFFQAIAILPFDRLAARLYADLPFARHRFDRLIAAHALSLKLTLVTANVKEYRDIAGLKIEDWTQ